MHDAVHQVPWPHTSKRWCDGTIPVALQCWARASAGLAGRWKARLRSALRSVVQCAGGTSALPFQSQEQLHT